MATAPSAATNSLRATALGLGSGGLIMTGFGLAWWGVSSQAIAYRSQLLYWGVLDFIALALLFISLRLLRSVRHLPHDLSPESVARGKATGRRFSTRFRLVFGLEVVIVAAVDTLLHLVQHAELFYPLLSIIVGLHFLPLAHIFRVPAYYLTGVLLCLAGLIVLADTSSTVLIGRASAWDMLPGLISGPILWLTAIYDPVQGRRILLRLEKLLQG